MIISNNWEMREERILWNVSDKSPFSVVTLRLATRSRESVACFRTWRWQGLKLLKCTRENYLFIRSFLSSELQYIVGFINLYLLLMLCTENHIFHDSFTRIDMQTPLSLKKITSYIPPILFSKSYINRAFKFYIYLYSKKFQCEAS